MTDTNEYPQTLYVRLADGDIEASDDPEWMIGDAMEVEVMEYRPARAARIIRCAIAVPIDVKEQP